MDEQEFVEKWDMIMDIIESSPPNGSGRMTLIVSLDDWNPSILYPKRKQLLQIIRKQEVESETQLARLVKRNRPNVIADLKLLEHYGLIKLEKNGKKMVPKPEKTQIIII